MKLFSEKLFSSNENEIYCALRVFHNLFVYDKKKTQEEVEVSDCLLIIVFILEVLFLYNIGYVVSVIYLYLYLS